MTRSSDTELIRRLEHALTVWECVTSDGPPDQIPRPSTLLVEARARLAKSEPQDKRTDTDAIRQVIQERNEAVRRYHDLAHGMIYHGNSVAHWHAKATAYKSVIGRVWDELRAAGIACDGKKSCTDGVRELAARKSPATQPEPQGLTDEELLRCYGLAKRDHCYEGPIDDWPKRAERAATVAGLRAVIAADRARFDRP